MSKTTILKSETENLSIDNLNVEKLNVENLIFWYIKFENMKNKINKIIIIK